MAFGTVVQTLEYNDALSSLTIDWTDGSAPTLGNLIIIFGGNRVAGSFSVPAGYTLAHKVDPWSGSSSTDTHIWYKIAAASEGNVTLTDGASGGSMFAVAVEVEGPWAESILGYTGSAEGTVAQGTGLAPGTTGTLAQADNFVYSTLIYRGNEGTEAYAPTAAGTTDGFSVASVIADITADDSAYNLSGAHFYKVTSATTALNPTHTWTMPSGDSLLSVAQIVTFKKSAAGGAGGAIPVFMHHYRQQGMI